MNAFQYIRRLDITDEYIFIFLGTEEYMDTYWSALYFLVFYRLTEKYNIYLSIMNVYSSVIIDQRLTFPVVNERELSVILGRWPSCLLVWTA
jgi:hypothetical protein